MGETRRKFDQDFRDGAVRLVRETGRPIAQVARELGVNEGTLGNWVALDRKRREDGHAALDKDGRAKLARLRRGVADLAMERDVVKRSGILHHTSYLAFGSFRNLGSGTPRRRPPQGVKQGRQVFQKSFRK